MKLLPLLILLLFLPFNGFTQVVFSETFDEADNSITGSDALGPVTWNTICPGSVNTSDYFKVVSGKLEAKDTNSPGAEWETGNIDISSCAGVQITFDLEETSNMEECASCGGTGLLCIDWVKLEYNIDGSGWAEVAGVTCPLAESPGEMIQIGDIAGGGPIAFSSPCVDLGTTLAIRITCMCWAAAEKWRFDNIEVSCLDCTLPIKIDDLSVKETRSGTRIDWSTLQEESNDYFTLERSYDGINFDHITTIDGAGNSSTKNNYSFDDLNVKYGNIVYYRLKQFDFDGKSSYSKTISIELTKNASAYYANNAIYFSFENDLKNPVAVNIYTIDGKLIQQSILEKDGVLPWDTEGFFILEIPSIGFHQKLIIR